MKNDSVTYSLAPQGEYLWIHYHPLVPQKNPQIVRDLTQQLQHFTQAGQLVGGPILKINGKHSIPMAYVLAHILTHRYGAIAVFDPTSSQYIVVVSHNPDYEVGASLS